MRRRFAIALLAGILPVPALAQTSTDDGVRAFVRGDYAAAARILSPLAETSEDLVVHELCHVWQDQNARLKLWTSYLYLGYQDNPHEIEARRAVAETN